MAYACAATFGTEAEVNNWSCKYCAEYKLINVTLKVLRLKPLTTLFWTSLDIQVIHLKIMPLLLLSEALLVFKIGLSTLTPLRYFTKYKGSISWMLWMSSSSRILQRFCRCLRLYQNWSPKTSFSSQRCPDFHNWIQFRISFDYYCCIRLAYHFWARRSTLYFWIT